MTKEKAIMELMTNAKQIEALESCIKILEGWSTLGNLAAPLKERMGKIEDESNHLYDVAEGGKFNLDKAF